MSQPAQNLPTPLSFDALRRRLEAAPIDDEPVTTDDLKAIEESEESIQRQGTVSHNEAMRTLGIL